MKQIDLNIIFGRDNVRRKYTFTLNVSLADPDSAEDSSAESQIEKVRDQIKICLNKKCGDPKRVIKLTVNLFSDLDDATREVLAEGIRLGFDDKDWFEEVECEVNNADENFKSELEKAMDALAARNQILLLAKVNPRSYSCEDEKDLWQKVMRIKIAEYYNINAQFRDKIWGTNEIITLGYVDHSKLIERMDIWGLRAFLTVIIQQANQAEHIYKKLAVYSKIPPYKILDIFSKIKKENNIHKIFTNIVFMQQSQFLFESTKTLIQSLDFNRELETVELSINTKGFTSDDFDKLIKVAEDKKIVTCISGLFADEEQEEKFNNIIASNRRQQRKEQLRNKGYLQAEDRGDTENNLVAFGSYSSNDDLDDIEIARKILLSGSDDEINFETEVQQQIEQEQERQQQRNQNRNRNRNRERKQDRRQAQQNKYPGDLPWNVVDATDCWDPTLFKRVVGNGSTFIFGNPTYKITKIAYPAWMEIRRTASFFNCGLNFDNLPRGFFIQEDNGYQVLCYDPYHCKNPPRALSPLKFKFNTDRGRRRFWILEGSWEQLVPENYDVSGDQQKYKVAFNVLKGTYSYGDKNSHLQRHFELLLNLETANNAEEIKQNLVKLEIESDLLYSSMFLVLLAAGGEGVRVLTKKLLQLQQHHLLTSFYKLFTIKARESKEDWSKFLEFESLKTFDEMCKLTAVERNWWNSLLDQCDGYQGSFVDLFEGFQYFLQQLELISKEHDIDLRLPLRCPLSGTKNLKVALDRLLVILQYADDPQQQLDNLEGLVLGDGESAFYAVRYEGFNFVCKEMGLVASKRKCLTENLSYKVSMDQLLKLSEDSDADFDFVAQCFYRYMGLQSKILPIDHYRTIITELDKIKIDEKYKKKLLPILAFSSDNKDRFKAHKVEEIISRLTKTFKKLKNAKAINAVLDQLTELRNLNKSPTLIEINSFINLLHNKNKDEICGFFNSIKTQMISDPDNFYKILFVVGHIDCDQDEFNFPTLLDSFKELKEQSLQNFTNVLDILLTIDVSKGAEGREPDYIDDAKLIEFINELKKNEPSYPELKNQLEQKLDIKFKIINITEYNEMLKKKIMMIAGVLFSKKFKPLLKQCLGCDDDGIKQLRTRICSDDVEININAICEVIGKIESSDKINVIFKSAILGRLKSLLVNYFSIDINKKLNELELFERLSKKLQPIFEKCLSAKNRDDQDSDTSTEYAVFIERHNEIINFLKVIKKYSQYKKSDCDKMLEFFINNYLEVSLDSLCDKCNGIIRFSKNRGIDLDEIFKLWDISISYEQLKCLIDTIERLPPEMNKQVEQLFSRFAAYPGDFAKCVKIFEEIQKCSEPQKTLTTINTIVLRKSKFQYLLKVLDEDTFSIDGFVEKSSKNPFSKRNTFKQFSSKRVERVVDKMKFLIGDISNYKKELKENFGAINRIGYVECLRTYRHVYKPIKDFTRDEIIQYVNKCRQIIKNSRSSEDKKKAKQHALAIFREVMFRATDKMPYSTQIIAVLNSVLSPDDLLLQIDTGEGKSIITPLLAMMSWLEGKSVVICTSNQGLAKRDLGDSKDFYDYLEVKSACVFANSPRNSYCKGGINYSTAPDMALYHSAAKFKGEKLKNKKNGVTLILDEADKTNFDEETEYNLAGNLDSGNSKVNPYKWIYPLLYDFVKDENNVLEGDDNGVVPKLLTFLRAEIENGIRKTGQLARISNKQFARWIRSACEVKKIIRNKHYIIEKGESSNIVLAKVLTKNGYTTPSTFSYGVQQILHAALKAKMPDNPNCFGEELADYDFPCHPERGKIDSKTSHDFVKYYSKSRGDRENCRVIGVTATAGSTTELEELKGELDKVVVIEMPSHRKNQREHFPSVYAKNSTKQIGAIKSRIRKCKKFKQPILIGCADIDAAEKMIKNLRLFAERSGYEIKLVTANKCKTSDEMEEAVRKASQNDVITVATPMFARGRDIKPENPEGLAVILTDVFSGRITKQFVGRAARNGKKGSAQCIYNLEEINKKCAEGKNEEKIRQIQEKFEKKEQSERKQKKAYGKINRRFARRFSKFNRLLRLCGGRCDLRKRHEILRQFDKQWEHVLESCNYIVEDAKNEFEQWAQKPWQSFERELISDIEIAFNKKYKLHDGQVKFTEEEKLVKSITDKDVWKDLFPDDYFKCLGKQLNSMLFKGLVSKSIEVPFDLSEQRDVKFEVLPQYVLDKKSKRQEVTKKLKSHLSNLSYYINEDDLEKILNNCGVEEFIPRSINNLLKAYRDKALAGKAEEFADFYHNCIEPIIEQAKCLGSNIVLENIVKKLNTHFKKTCAIKMKPNWLLCLFSPKKFTAKLRRKEQYLLNLFGVISKYNGTLLKCTGKQVISLFSGKDLSTQKGAYFLLLKSLLEEYLTRTITRRWVSSDRRKLVNALLDQIQEFTASPQKDIGGFVEILNTKIVQIVKDDCETNKGRKSSKISWLLPKRKPNSRLLKILQYAKNLACTTIVSQNQIDALLDNEISTLQSIIEKVQQHDGELNLLENLNNGLKEFERDKPQSLYEILFELNKLSESSNRQKTYKVDFGKLRESLDNLVQRSSYALKVKQLDWKNNPNLNDTGKINSLLAQADQRGANLKIRYELLKSFENLLSSIDQKFTNINEAKVIINEQFKCVLEDFGLYSDDHKKECKIEKNTKDESGYIIKFAIPDKDENSASLYSINIHVNIQTDEISCDSPEELLNESSRDSIPKIEPWIKPEEPQLEMVIGCDNQKSYDAKLLNLKDTFEIKEQEQEEKRKNDLPDQNVEPFHPKKINERGFIHTDRVFIGEKK